MPTDATNTLSGPGSSAGYPKVLKLFLTLLGLIQSRSTLLPNSTISWLLLYFWLSVLFKILAGCWLSCARHETELCKRKEVSPIILMKPEVWYVWECQAVKQKPYTFHCEPWGMPRKRQAVRASDRGEEKIPVCKVRKMCFQAAYIGMLEVDNLWKCPHLCLDRAFYRVKSRISH